jgi:ATP-dependent exoDNAse (exonuclease V) alpha subunit
MPRSGLSKQQRAAFDLIYEHTFGPSHVEQLLLIVIGTAGTGKSFLINAICYLFEEQDCAESLKVTIPTGIAAANIQGSTVFSLLSLMNHNLSGERLHRTQMVMKDVKLLVIDEYSFLSAATIDALDHQHCKIFPQVAHPFGGLNIVLCGDPAQLPPVLAQPVYAHRGLTRHLAARFHLFDKVVELDQPFRQAGNDETQKRFRLLLRRVANCDATDEDWAWLQTRRASHLSPRENAIFDKNKYIVSTNDMRSRINCEKLSMLSPIMQITQTKDGMCVLDEDEVDGERIESDGVQMYAIGAEVMLTFNMWTEAGLVNGACGKVVSILKPQDDGDAWIVMVNIPGYRGPALSPEQPCVVPITQIRTSNFNGMPLTLAWAITIHKAQGMMMDQVTIDLGQKEFSSGLTFVALSCARSFYGLRVLPFDLDRYKQIRSGKYVEARREEFRRLRQIAVVTAASS